MSRRDDERVALPWEQGDELIVDCGSDIEAVGIQHQVLRKRIGANFDAVAVVDSRDLGGQGQRRDLEFDILDEVQKALRECIDRATTTSPAGLPAADTPDSSTTV